MKGVIITVVSLLIIITLAFFLLRQMKIEDTFEGQSGSLPNDRIWYLDSDCDMTNIGFTTEGGMLRESGAYGKKCLPDGWVGFGVYTKKTFSNFDMSVQYLGSEGPGWGYGGVWVMGADKLPPGKNFGAFRTGFNFGPAGNKFSIMWGLGSTNSAGLNVTLNAGDIIRLVGTPGSRLQFYLNDKEIYSVEQWNPPVKRFVAGLYSRPGGTVGEWRVTWYDHFKLVSRRE